MKDHQSWFPMLNICPFLLLRTFKTMGIINKDLFSNYQTWIIVILTKKAAISATVLPLLIRISMCPFAIFSENTGERKLPYQNSLVLILPVSVNTRASVLRHGSVPSLPASRSVALPSLLLQFPAFLRGLAECLSFAVLYIPLCMLSDRCICLPRWLSITLSSRTILRGTLASFWLLHACPFPPSVSLPHSSRRPPETFAYSITVFHPGRRLRSPL